MDEIVFTPTSIPPLKGEETRKDVSPSNRRRRKRIVIFRKYIIKNLWLNSIVIFQYSVHLFGPVLIQKQITKN
jgi:hypothetical protein